VSLNRTAIFVLAVLLGFALAAGVWYVAVYDTAAAKCQRGDLGACVVAAAQHSHSAGLGRESCGGVQYAQDGNPYPLFCPDGHPSLAADGVLRTTNPGVFRLGPHASADGVQRVMCMDLSQGSTVPITYSAYEVARVEQGWTFTVSETFAC